MSDNEIKKIGVIGAGSWGTALSVSLASRGYEVVITDVDQEHVKALSRDRENKKYLPKVMFPDTIRMTDSSTDAAEDADVVLFSAPSQHFRSAYENAKDYIPEKAIVVNVAKGIEQKSLMTMSQIAAELGRKDKYVVLSGPSHAEEVGIGMPTTLVAASKDHDSAKIIQDTFMSPVLRVYTSDDVIGVELGGSLKNIIALGAGISDGMGFGDNAKAAMMTRGIAEMKRLGVALGANINTFSGLTGIGDLIVTCCSMHSRNRRCGIMIGEGLAPSEAIKKVGMVVEGMYTTEAAYQLAEKLGVEMPITSQIYDVINEKIDPKTAVTNLMLRDKKPEEDS